MKFTFFFSLIWMMMISAAHSASVVYHFVPITAFNGIISSSEGLIGMDSETDATGGTVVSDLVNWLVSGESEKASLSATTEQLPLDSVSIGFVEIYREFTIFGCSPIRTKSVKLLGEDSLDVSPIMSLSSYFPLEGALELARKQFGKRRMKDFDTQAIEGILRIDG